MSDDVYNEGYGDALKYAFSHNPYLYGSEEWREYWRGYDDGCRDLEDEEKNDGS